MIYIALNFLKVRYLSFFGTTILYYMKPLTWTPMHRWCHVILKCNHICKRLLSKYLMRYHYFTMTCISNVGVSKRNCNEQQRMNYTILKDDFQVNRGMLSLKDSFKGIVKYYYTSAYFK